MTPKHAPHQEVIEPLRQFLETLTQELTEHKFIPAFRDELRTLISALENLQHSEESLQQISRGVDRLRELFAPASTRLHEGVKELEGLMKTHVGDLKERSGEILKSVAQTHEQLEASLRTEGELIREQSGKSREAMGRVGAEMESRFTHLTSQLESLFRKFENEADALKNSLPQVIEVQPPALQAAPQVSSPVAVTLGDDVREALRKTESVVLEELRRYRKESDKKAEQRNGAHAENWDKIHQLIQESLASVGPKLQDELEAHIAMLRDQMQILITAQADARTTAAIQNAASSGDTQPAVPSISPELVTAALHASENRIVQEFAQTKKAITGELSGAKKVLSELEKNFSEAAARQTERIASESEQIRESLRNLDRMLGEGRDNERGARDGMNAIAANVHGLHDSLREQTTLWISKTDQISKHLDQGNQALTGKIEEDRGRFTQITDALQRTEQAATAATDSAVSEGRVQREKIEAGLRDLREQMERKLSDNGGLVTRTLQEVSESWTSNLEQLRIHVEHVLRENVDHITRRMASVEGVLVDRDKSRESFEHDMVSELRRGTSIFDEKFDGLKSSTAAFSTAVESHVKAVAGEVAALRARQDQQLSVLREAIRANYDENAARLKEVIDAGTDHFLKQAVSIPQALERYSHLIQSLHQGDQIALQAIASDARNLLAMSGEKFEILQAETGGMKKLLPLLDRKLEKHTTDIDLVRKAQTVHDRGIEELGLTINGVRDTTERRVAELRASVTEFEQRTLTQFNSTRETAEQIASELRSLQSESLPAFKRELTSQLATKFDFMETTTSEREQALRNEIMQRFELNRKQSNKIYLLIGLLCTLGLSLQFCFHVLSTSAK